MRYTKFTIRIKLYKDELLSSFMMRLAKANNIDFLSFWRMVKRSGDKYAQMSNIYFLNHSPNRHIDCRRLAQMAGIKPEDILQMTLYNLLRTFSIRPQIDRSRFISGAIRENLNYCPLCIKENPYLRNIWRISGMDICSIHGVQLLDKCFRCNCEIKYNDITCLCICPYCGQNLADNDSVVLCNQEMLNTQKWYDNSLNYLLSSKDLKLEAADIVVKLLFLLNGQKTVFIRDNVIDSMDDPKLLPTLLQHARGTLSQERTIHLMFILSVLKKYNINIEDFISMKVPQSFLSSIKSENKPRIIETCCQAPWCKNFGKKDTLITVSTSYLKTKNGKFRSFFLVCPECWSEYDYRDSNTLRYRTTNFIKEYIKLNDMNLAYPVWKDISIQTGISAERLDRAIAYFAANEIIDFGKPKRDFIIDNDKLHEFILLVKDGVNVDDIRKAIKWNSRMEFLFHRFYRTVLEAEVNYKICGHDNKQLTKKQDIIAGLIKQMILKDMKITIKSVSEYTGVCKETLRCWGCCPIIRQLKHQNVAVR